MPQKTTTSLGMILIGLFLSTSPASAAKLYKWVDENGKVRYTDYLPPKQTQRAHQTLSSQGLVVGHTEAPKTERQLAEEKQRRTAEAALKKLQLDEQQQEREQSRKDQILMLSFSTEAQISNAHRDRIQAIDAVIDFLDVRLLSATKKLERMRRTAQTAYRDQGLPVPVELKESINQTKLKTAQYQKLRARKKIEKKQLREELDLEMARFRFLKAQGKQ